MAPIPADYADNRFFLALCVIKKYHVLLDLF